MDQETILRYLRELFDADWPWQLRSMDEFSYLVRFPPGQRVDRIVINKISYFYLEKGTVMASLKVWNGNIEPVSSLTEVWVQVRVFLLNGVIGSPLGKWLLLLGN